MNVEAYADDVVIKTQTKKDLIYDLAETFMSLTNFSIKLNPDKCTFGVPSGKLLGYLVSDQGIKANPEKVAAISKMGPPNCL